MRLIDMGQQQLKKRPILAPVLEDYAISLEKQPSVRYKPHKYGSAPKLESQYCTCLSRFSFFGRLRDRYIKAMNEMAMGGDFTAVTGYHGWGLEHGYNLQRCNIANDRQMDALQEQSDTAITTSRSQRQSAGRVLTFST